MLVEVLKSDRPIDALLNVGHLRVREGIAGAGVTTGWATESGFGFRGGVINGITSSSTSALEGVIESDPVAN